MPKPPKAKIPDAILDKDFKIPEPRSCVDLTISWVPFPARIESIQGILGPFDLPLTQSSVGEQSTDDTSGTRTGEQDRSAGTCSNA